MSSLNMSIVQLSAKTLNNSGMMFIRWYCCLVIPVGVVGHLMSIYVFTRPKLKRNRCSVYLLSVSIFGLLETYYSLPMRMIQSGFIDIDPGAYSLMFCKMTWFALFSIRGLNSWLVVLACGDRYLSSSTSVGKRAWSSVRVAIRLISLTIVLNLISYIHVPIYFTINIIVVTHQSICYPTGPPGSSRIFLSFFNLIYFGLFPSICMFVFGLLTLRNIERSKRLVVVPSTDLLNRINKTNRQINRHMLRMLFIQVFVYCLTGLSYSIASIYTSITVSQSISVFQLAQYNLITAVVGMLSNSGPCLTFYFFTLSSRLFRKEIRKLFNRFNRIVNDPEEIPIRLPHTDRVRMRTKLN